MIFYFCITWLPTYLHERHGFEATALGIFCGVPLLVSVPSDLFGGVVTDRLVVALRSSGRALSRRRARVLRLTAFALIAAGLSSSPVAAAMLIAARHGGVHVHARRGVGHVAAKSGATTSALSAPS